jgi:hypothetical protein
MAQPAAYYPPNRRNDLLRRDLGAAPVGYRGYFGARSGRSPGSSDVGGRVSGGTSPRGT